MQLNYNGTLATFYRWSYGRSPSNNFCPFFWRLLFAFALLPLTWLSYPFKDRGIIARTALSLLTLAALVAVAITIGDLMMGQVTFVSALVIVVAIILVAAAVILGLAGFLLIEYLPEVWEGSKAQELAHEMTDIVSTKKESLLDRYCPKIEWKYENE